MHAVVIEDNQLVWQERPDPVPGDTEALVAVQAAGINAADLMQRDGNYPAPRGAPADIPGLELAGEVVAVGRQVTRFKVGARVMALVGGGGQATMAAVDESHLLTVPDGIGWPEAGGFPEVFSTAFDALFTNCGLQVGERVLVTGAAGGVGTAAVQLASVAGAHVVASVRDAARAEAVAGLGAEVVVDPADVGAHGRYDVVLELIGAASLPSAFDALALEGRLIVIGVGGGRVAELNLLELMNRRARIMGSTLRYRNRAQKAAVTAAMAAQVVPLLASGKVTVPVLATFPMAEAIAGYGRFEAGGKLGKVVLTA